MMRKLPLTSENQKGQALLVVLLTMAVLLTVVLSVASKSVVDIQTTGYEEEALRAFSAAEAGVEQYLLTESSSGGSAVAVDPIDASITYASEEFVTSPGNSYAYPYDLDSGESAAFWFVSHDADGNLVCGGSPCTRSNSLQVCWGQDAPLSAVDTPAVEIKLFYDADGDATAVAEIPNNFEDLEVRSYSIDNNSGRALAYGFIGAGTNCTIAGDYTFNYTIPLNADLPGTCFNTEGCLLMAKIKVFYNSEPQPVAIGVTGGSTIPAQGALISSTGTAGEVTRKVNVMQGYPLPPSPFDNVLFSPNDITK